MTRLGRYKPKEPWPPETEMIKHFIWYYVQYYHKKYGYSYTKNQLRDMLRIRHLEEFLNTQRYKLVRNTTSNGFVLDPNANMLEDFIPDDEEGYDE
jgi:hypothetical protein